MKTVTQNSMLCYTYNTKRCKSFKQNRRRIQNWCLQFLNILEKESHNSLEFATNEIAIKLKLIEKRFQIFAERNKSLV
jgi:hypothetical protein